MHAYTFYICANFPENCSVRDEIDLDAVEETRGPEFIGKTELQCGAAGDEKNEGEDSKRGTICPKCMAIKVAEQERIEEERRRAKEEMDRIERERLQKEEDDRKEA